MLDNHHTTDELPQARVALITDHTTRPSTFWRISRQRRAVIASPRAPKGTPTDEPTIELALALPTNDGDFTTIATFPLAVAADIAEVMYRMAHDPAALDRTPTDEETAD